MSDTHFWSKTSAKDELWEFYDRAKDKWVECFIHAWDLVDWDGVYKWQTYELEKIWFDAQLDDVVENYPWEFYWEDLVKKWALKYKK